MEEGRGNSSSIEHIPPKASTHAYTNAMHSQCPFSLSLLHLVGANGRGGYRIYLSGLYKLLANLQEGCQSEQHYKVCFQKELVKSLNRRDVHRLQVSVASSDLPDAT